MILEDTLLAMCGFSLSTCLGFSRIVTARFSVDRDGGEDALISVCRVSEICGTSLLPDHCWVYCGYCEPISKVLSILMHFFQVNFSNAFIIKDLSEAISSSQ